VAILAIKSEQEKETIARSICNMVQESWEWLNQTLQLLDRGLADVLSPLYIAR
jgi:hypothetical protein